MRGTMWKKYERPGITGHSLRVIRRGPPSTPKRCAQSSEALGRGAPWGFSPRLLPRPVEPTSDRLVWSLRPRQQLDIHSSKLHAQSSAARGSYFFEAFDLSLYFSIVWRLCGDDAEAKRQPCLTLMTARLRGPGSQLFTIVCDSLTHSVPRVFIVLSMAEAKNGRERLRCSRSGD